MSAIAAGTSKKNRTNFNIIDINPILKPPQFDLFYGFEQSEKKIFQIVIENHDIVSGAGRKKLYIVF